MDTLENINKYLNEKMKVCTQCANPTNKPVKVNGEIVCQSCAAKLGKKNNEGKEVDKNFVLKVVLDSLKARYKDGLIKKELYDKAVKLIKKDYK